MAPAVARRRKFRATDPPMKLDRNLPHIEAFARRTDDHLGCELHTDGPQVEGGQHIAPNCAHPAMRIVNVRSVDDVEKARENRITQTAQQRHRARCDAAHPVADDKLRAVLELLDETRNLAEVVREVGIDHDDEVALGGGEAGEIRASIAATRLLDHEGARSTREIAAAVRRAVVDDDDFACKSALVEDGAGPGHAFRDRLRLVQARDHDGHARLDLVVTRTALGLPAWEYLRRAGLHRLRLPIPLHHRRGRTVVSQPRRTPCIQRPRGYLPHSPAVGTRRGARHTRRARHCRLAAHGALRAWPPAHPAAAAVRPRRARPPRSSRQALRRRPHRLVSVLLTAGGRSCAAARAVPLARRLARGLDARILARIPGRTRRPDRVADPARLLASPPTGILLLTAPGATPARARASRGSDAPGRAVRGAAGRGAAPHAPPGCGLRRPAHPGEARPGARPGARGGAAGNPESARRNLWRRA